MKDLPHFVQPLKNFETRSIPFQLEVFGWFLHVVKQKEHFKAADIGPCFDELHIKRPINIGSSLNHLANRTPARLLKSAKGFRLTATSRAEMGMLLPQQRATTVQTTALLNGLIDKITDPGQKAFLTETLLCFKHGAHRAAIVMAWNLAYSDVIDRILANHLTEFNAQMPKVLGPKAAPVTKRSDFEDIKESKTIEIGRGANILSSSTSKILTEKLNKRNSAAHPTMVVMSAVTAEEVVFDLVTNVILNKSL